MKATLTRLLLALVGAALLAACLIGTASAAPGPNNKNANTIPVECEGIGAFDVSSVDNAATAFGPDGEVYVAKRIAGTFETTFSVEGGPTFTETETFDDGGQGNGYAGRLIECSFTQEEHDEFILDERAAEFFGLDPSLIGATVTFDATGEGTAWVVAPGR